MAAHILIVDDERLIRWSLREALRKAGYETSEAMDAGTAEAALRQGGLDLILLDLRLPDADGLTVLRHARELIPGIPVIVITAYSTVDGAVQAMKCGAADYVTKPFEIDELLIVVQRTIEHASMQQRLTAHVAEQKARFGLDNVIGNSPGIGAIKDLIRRIAGSENATVLLLGESGTGKDMFARAIHYESRRVDGPFVNVTCTALPETLLESELFGYEKGAFTDARAQKKGLFEIAHGGTIFLDEIGDMPPLLQSKLLRVLEEKTFKRIGGTHDISVDVRVVAATHRDIDEAIRQGRFREDLYYRLSTVPVHIPPLRERAGDLALLTEHFLRVYSCEFHRDGTALAPEAMDKLHAYGWPGNVRELRNVIERAVLLAAGVEITAQDIVLGRLSIQPAAPAGRFRFVLPREGCRVDDVERDFILQALERTGGNRTQAADLLGMTRDQIRYGVRKYGLDAFHSE